MIDYRLYFLDSAGHIVRGEEFVAPSDEAALEHARQYVNGKALELWNMTRLVARIEPEASQTSAN
jgi:hypothetical protein